MFNYFHPSLVFIHFLAILFSYFATQDPQKFRQIKSTKPNYNRIQKDRIKLLLHLQEKNESIINNAPWRAERTKL